jgi:sulfatase maturation enzyme AslB (radical SAM superfamily)
VIHCLGIGKSPAVSKIIHEPAQSIEKEMGYSHVIDKMTIAGKVFCKKLIFHNVCHGLCKKN